MVHSLEFKKFSFCDGGQFNRHQQRTKTSQSVHDSSLVWSKVPKLLCLELTFGVPRSLLLYDNMKVTNV